MKVILLMAQTLDGMISRSSDEFIDWTGSADKKLFVKLTREAGVVIMGSKTYDTIGKPLPGRKNVVLTRNKQRKSEFDNLLYTDKSPQLILDDLTKEGYEKVTVIGGAQINSLFAEHNLIDEILITICPIVFGEGLSLFDLPLDMKFNLLSTEILEENFVLLHYSIVRE